MLARIHQSRTFINNANNIIYDVVVVGGGHAGCEGAAASARCGANTLLITHKKSSIGEMSCNPKVDALDGLCGRLCDKSAITYQALNRAKGPAVLGLRAQIDRKVYRKEMQLEILNTPNLTVIEAAVEDLSLEDISFNPSTSLFVKPTHRIRGCILADGTEIRTKSVLITTGTFLNGQIFQGLETKPAGRIGDPASCGLSNTLNKLGIELGRLRTKTPPRLIGSTIDFSKFQRIAPDAVPLPTYIGYTNSAIAKVVLENMHENLYLETADTDDIRGPRNCPSLESKIIRFPDLAHRLYLEHEGLDTDIIYPQSMSLSFKPEVQLKIMRLIPGMENVEIQQYGYGVHYDFVNPQQLHTTLETKKVKGLFLAGQINGTTGYEEAAAQGILAGINSALRAKDYQKGPLTIDRSQDFRLTETGYSVGAVGEERFKTFMNTKRRYEDCVNGLNSIVMSIDKWNRIFLHLNATKKFKVSGLDMVSKFHITLKQMANIFPSLFNKYSDDLNLEERIRNEARYSIYQEDLTKNIETMRKETQTLLPEKLCYLDMQELSLECREKLDQQRPQNIAAASRIPGISADALVHLLRYATVARNNVQI